jgi:predicted transposase/invertase (TIGR01784 family)
MKLGIDPTVDYAFKRLFGREQNTSLLIDLVNAILQEPPERQVTVLEILNPFQDKDFVEDKMSILDIKARDASGRQFNIEMQVLIFGSFRERLLYYWARLHQSQLAEGADYSTMRPTVAICFVNAELFADRPDWHATFELRERQSGILFNDQLAIHILELPKFSKLVSEVSSPLDRWMYFLRHGEELDPESLPVWLNDPSINRAVGELKMMTQSELERERYEARLKWQRDYAAALCDARQEGEARALANEVQRFQRILQHPVTNLHELRQRSLTELNDLVRALEEQLTSVLATKD